MFESIPLDNKYFYHNIISLFMLMVWIIVGLKGYNLKDLSIKSKISMYLITFSLLQEIVDFINRIFLDPNYLFSVQRDLPFLQFCQISFYFSLLCILISTKNNKTITRKYPINQFFFDSAFLLGFSGAFQGIITPEFLNINITIVNRLAHDNTLDIRVIIFFNTNYIFNR